MRKPRYILGIYCYFHDSSACLLADGELVAMAEEERFNREKHTFAFPVNAIRFCLKKGGINLDQVDSIAYGFHPTRFLKTQLISAITKLPASINLLKPGASYMPLFSKILKMMTLQYTFRQNFPGPVPPIKYIDHHTAHAYSAFWVSKFKEAAILIVDGFGEDTATSLYYGRGNNIKKLISLPYHDSLGVYYGAVTQYLGFRPHNDEYKVMGMTAYGSDQHQSVFVDMLRTCNDDLLFKLNTGYINLYTNGVRQWFSKKLVRALGPAREYSSEYSQKHFDIAFSAQKRLEDVVARLGAYLYQLTGSKNLCIAGGVAQNVLMNSMLLKQGNFKKIYVPPVAYDGGSSLGAALAVHHRDYSGKRTFVLNRANWGPSFTNDECIEALKLSGLVPEINKDQSSAVANLLVKGKIVGYFDGAMEIGPRALGYRSILADPRKGKVKDLLNSRIKKREFFRPFAPIVTLEDVNKYFEIPDESPFMTMVARVRNPKLLPGITHADGTARIQTVRRQISPHIYTLLKKFQKLSGVPVLLNTSFNENEPIVCNPGEAVNCFMRTKMDALVFNNQILVTKK